MFQWNTLYIILKKAKKLKTHIKTIFYIIFSTARFKKMCNLLSSSTPKVYMLTILVFQDIWKQFSTSSKAEQSKSLN